MKKNAMTGVHDKNPVEVLSALNEVKPGCIGEERINPDCRLGADLGFTSLDFVRFAAILRRRLNSGPLQFQRLFVNADGSFSNDLTIRRIIEFLDDAQPSP
jgi:hypothetical protein